jgi:hypothetical protein
MFQIYVPEHTLLESSNNIQKTQPKRLAGLDPGGGSATPNQVNAVPGGDTRNIDDSSIQPGSLRAVCICDHVGNETRNTVCLSLQSAPRQETIHIEDACSVQQSHRRSAY